jgi:cellulose synthase operon protein C
VSRVTRLPGFAAALLLCACQTSGLKNPITRETPPTTVGDIAEHNDFSRVWGLNRLLAPTPSTLRVEASAPVAGDVRVAIAQYEAMIELDGDPRLRAEALQRAADLRLQRADADEGEDDDLAVATAHYRRILAEHPQFPAIDRVLYQLARAQQLGGNETQAAATLRQLGNAHPDSVRSIEARFRAGELLFQKRDYAAAADEYRAVLEAVSGGGDAGSSYAEPAQYKYAWALFQQHQYAQALPVLLAILDRELARGELHDPEAALAQLAVAKADMVAESLRIAGLSFAALGGGIAIGETLAQPGSPQRLDALLHAALAQQLLERERYSDAADTWAAFIARHPQHAQAPQFQARIIEAWRDAGFAELALAAQRDYVERYAADAAYWNGRTPDADVAAALHAHLDTLARHHHARAQRDGSSDDYLRAAHWYRRSLDLYPPVGPDDTQQVATRLLLAEALLDGGRTADAAREFEIAAYDGPQPDADAAHAAVLAWRRIGESAPADARAAALQAQIDSGLRLAAQFPQHAQRAPILAATAADLLELGEHARAAETATQALAAQPAPAPQRIALSVLADAQFARSEYAEAEQAYAQLLALLPEQAEATQRSAVVERYAASIYRQAEHLRDAGELAAAAPQFLRVGQMTPTASIRAVADFDAAAALIGLRDWSGAARVLEAFRARFGEHASEHPLIAEVDRKLAVAYDEQQQLAAAAVAYTRIAARSSEPAADRRSAAWRAAQRYDSARLWAAAERAYERYLHEHAPPVDTAMQARLRLADLAAGDPERERRWLREIVAAERGAGAARNEALRSAAADAQLRLGRVEAAAAARIALELPIERSLSRRTAATQSALAALTAAVDYGYAETTTAATYEIAALYRDLGRALMDTPRPALRSELEREQYELLLEEQAYPFEDSAIKAHEANLGRVGQGVWNEWVQRSAAALTEMAPGRYGKHERRELRYDTPG